MRPRKGEVPFAVPLPVTLAAAGKVRKRPSAGSPVAWSIERNASPVAFSKGPGVRVKGGGDRWGWMFYNLLAYP